MRKTAFLLRKSFSKTLRFPFRFKSLIPIKYSLHIVIKTSTQFSYLMKSKTSPLYVRNGVQVFKLIAPSIRGYFEKNVLLCSNLVWHQYWTICLTHCVFYLRLTNHLLERVGSKLDYWLVLTSWRSCYINCHGPTMANRIWRGVISCFVTGEWKKSNRGRR